MQNENVMAKIILDISDYLNENWLRVKQWDLPPFGTLEFKKKIPDKDLQGFMKTAMFNSAVNILHQIVKNDKGVMSWDYEWPDWLLKTHYPDITIANFASVYAKMLKRYAPGTVQYYTFYDDRPPLGKPLPGTPLSAAP